MRFSELLEPQKGSSVQDIQRLQQLARQRFPVVLHEHGLILRDPKERIPAHGNFVVIGVAAGYSNADLQFLDEIAAVLKQVRGDRIEIFDASTLKNMEEFEAFIPSIASVYQTPIVGFWVDGVLSERTTGKPARDFLRARYLKDS